MPSKKKNDDKPKEVEVNPVDEIMADLQRTRADFENYQRRTEQEKKSARESGRSSAVLALLPVIDNIERAISHTPPDLADNPWAKSVSGLTKQLDKSMTALNVARIDASVGSVFDPHFHEAVQFDEEAEGDVEIILEQLQAGYTLDGSVIRHAMVKVGRK